MTQYSDSYYRWLIATGNPQLAQEMYENGVTPPDDGPVPPEVQEEIQRRMASGEWKLTGYPDPDRPEEGPTMQKLPPAWERLLGTPYQNRQYTNFPIGRADEWKLIDTSTGRGPDLPREPNMQQLPPNRLLEPNISGYFDGDYPVFPPGAWERLRKQLGPLPPITFESTTLKFGAPWTSPEQQQLQEALNDGVTEAVRQHFLAEEEAVKQWMAETGLPAEEAELCWQPSAGKSWVRRKTESVLKELMWGRGFLTYAQINELLDGYGYGHEPESLHELILSLERQGMLEHDPTSEPLQFGAQAKAVRYRWVQ